jgi:hypothetical protein
MNRKFVKENKQLVKEFLGNLLVKIISGKLNRDLTKKIENDPAFKSRQKEMEKLEKQMLDRITQMRKNDPNFAKKMADLGISVSS